MQKIPTLFVRDWNGDRSRVTEQVTPGCEWVLAGEGVATQKLDGTCCLIRDGRLYKRHEVKPGRTSPPGFVAVDTDDETGKTVGWIPVGDGREDKWHREAYDAPEVLPDGTYELVGPKIQGNPEGFVNHILIRHYGAEMIDVPDRSYTGLAALLATLDVEGLVFHHPDGRMAKIKKRDFGLRRQP